jgi:hypothetical protein
MGQWVVSKAAECRRLAQQCLIAARGTVKKDARVALLQRAQVWLEMAQWLEKEEEALAPRPGERAQPVVQQQQQQAQPGADDCTKRDETPPP